MIEQLERWISTCKDDDLRAAHDALTSLYRINFPEAFGLLMLINGRIAIRDRSYVNACPNCFPAGFSLTFANEHEYHTAGKCPCEIEERELGDPDDEGYGIPADPFMEKN